MLTVQGLRKTFAPARRESRPIRALDDVTLSVLAGAFASVLGPSGSGKTTLLRCIAGFERPDGGVITLDGRELASARVFVRPYERGIGVVPQEGALFPHLTAAQNISFGLSGRPRRERRERTEALLELVGLPGLGHRRPDQLSGGQQQRVALARALAPEPALVLLDEPFSALDAQLRVELREEVRELLRKLQSTVLLVTHDQAEAMSLSDHLIVMRDGRVVAAGDPREVYDQPAEPELGQFLGDALVVPGEISGGSDGVYVVCALGRLKVGRWHGQHGACRVLIRPEQIELDPVDGPQQRPEGVIGTITSQSYFGHDSLMRVAAPGVSDSIPVRVSGRRSFQVGDSAEVRVTQRVSTYAASSPIPSSN